MSPGKAFAPLQSEPRQSGPLGAPTGRLRRLKAAGGASVVRLSAGPASGGTARAASTLVAATVGAASLVVDGSVPPAASWLLVGRGGGVGAGSSPMSAGPLPVARGGA